MASAGIDEQKLLTATVMHQVLRVHLHVRRPVCMEHSIPEDLRAVSDPGLSRKQLNAHFFSLAFDVCSRC